MFKRLPQNKYVMNGAKEYFLEMQQKWINETPYSNIGRIFDKELLQEFTDYEIESKAQRVYKLCLRVGKFNLAENIYIKYRLTEKHDSTVAIGLALLASTKINKH